MCSGESLRVGLRTLRVVSPSVLVARLVLRNLQLWMRELRQRLLQRIQDAALGLPSSCEILLLDGHLLHTRSTFLLCAGPKLLYGITQHLVRGNHDSASGPHTGTTGADANSRCANAGSHASGTQARHVSDGHGDRVQDRILFVSGIE